MKNTFIKVLAAAAAAAMMTAFLPAIPARAQAQETKLIALTFDDGPNTTTTNDVLDILEEYGAKASFFLIGDNINEDSAKSVKRAYDMGCEIDNHSKTHSNMGGMAPDDIKAEVEFVDQKVLEITGEHTKFFRPPFIDVSQTMYDNIDTPFICAHGCRDWEDDVSADERLRLMLDNENTPVQDGMMFLLHVSDKNDTTLEVVDRAIPILKERGYSFATVPQLFEMHGIPKKNNGQLWTVVGQAHS